MNSNDIERINSLLKTYSDVTAFIKDFILRFRFADIAVQSIEQYNENAMLSFSTTHQMCEAYRNSANDIIEKYNNNVMEICSSTNVKNYCENDKLTELKQKLDDEKKSAFEKIIKQYNGIDEFGYNSGRLSDFMIYNEYMNYISGDDFYYDDNNPYIVELFYNLNEFMKVRERVESNGTNIADMIIQFNSMCGETLGQYWGETTKDYYGRIKEIFQYDFYDANENELIEAKINDEDRVTLYKKVLDYLKVLVKYTAPISNESKYENLDVQTIVNMGSEESNNDTTLQKLRKIAITFVTLRKIDTEIGSSFFEQYMSKEDLNSLFTLKDILKTQQMSLKDYTVACAVNPTLLAFNEVMKKYQGMIKGITDNESKVLRELSDRAISWYLTYASDIDSGNLFKQFEEIAWPSPTTIYKDGQPLDFYFVEHKKDTRGGVTENESDPLANYQYSTDSLYTQHGINSLSYWLKYCAIATIANCMLPMYWSTGIIVAGSPVKLPIIFIPIIVLSNRVITVIGIGLCGVCPLPMFLFMNVGDVPGYTIPALNILVDKLKKLPPKLADKGNDLIKNTLKGLIKNVDNEINDINARISDINTKIRNINAGVNIDRETERNIKKRNRINPTSNKK